MSQKPQKPAGGGPSPESALSKSYDPHSIEKRIYETWEKAGDFSPSAAGGRPTAS